MCLAIPGKIIRMEGKKALVDYGSQQTAASVVDGSFKVGDYVIVQGRIIVDKVPASQVKKWKKLLTEVESQKSQND